MHDNPTTLPPGPDGVSEGQQSLRPWSQSRPWPELLAPAGDWACARAAVENGADAIYFGLERHNARMRADNFTAADVPGLMEYLHGRGVKGYATFNTLVFADELAEAEVALRGLIVAGVDAAIVQDVGICRLIRKLSPDFPIHASTQMTITSAAGVAFARDLGCSLVVLARECSIREIEALQAACSSKASSAAPPQPLPLEVFIHGALCVAYSGQCLTSESLGGRSANRGVCAQACRLPYELIADGQRVDLGDRRYLLSPRDLAGVDLLPQLMRAGVASLKIEGRLKSPEYVANITRVYRHALDRIAAAWPAAGSAEPHAEPGASVQTQTAATAVNPLAQSLAEAARYDMEMAFSRGLHSGWLRGVNNQDLVHGRFGKKRGVLLGTVTRVQAQTVSIVLTGPIKPGDGVVFDAGHPEEPEEGGRVYAVKPAGPQGKETVLAFGSRDIDFRRVRPGDKVWKTSDPQLERRLRQSFTGNQPRFRRPLQMQVQGRAGQPLRLRVDDGCGHAVECLSGQPLIPAASQPLTSARLRQQLGRLGGTPFYLSQLHIHIDGAVILPVSELNRLRRDAVAQLAALRKHPPRWQLCPEPVIANRMAAVASPVRPRKPEIQTPAATHSADRQLAELIVLARSLPQLEAALECGIRTVYCELENPKQYPAAVARVRAFRNHPPTNSASVAAGRPMDSTLYVAPPRICKPGEDWILQQVRASGADGFLARNYDHLRFFADCRVVGDYSLNVANALSAEYFHHRFALERLTASYDLNLTQLTALLRTAPPEWFEVTLHQHMPMFHMEHCVFCAFLSAGTDYTNCGRPCDKHDVQLRDRVGAEHGVKADAGCRNTVFNARAQTGAEAAERLSRMGVRHFRIEFLDETPDQVIRTIHSYQKLLRGEMTGSQLWRDLKLLNQLGVTRGQFDKPEAAHA